MFPLLIPHPLSNHLIFFFLWGFVLGCLLFSIVQYNLIYSQIFRTSKQSMPLLSSRTSSLSWTLTLHHWFAEHLFLNVPLTISNWTWPKHKEYIIFAPYLPVLLISLFLLTIFSLCLCVSLSSPPSHLVTTLITSCHWKNFLISLSFSIQPLEMCVCGGVCS